MQNDGNLVLYTRENEILWASNTRGNGTPPYTLVMQRDNDLVVHDKDNHAVWSTLTAHQHMLNNVPNGAWVLGAYARLRDDGRFVVYDGKNKVMWESGARKGVASTKFGSGFRGKVTKQLN